MRAEVGKRRRRFPKIIIRSVERIRESGLASAIEWRVCGLITAVGDYGSRTEIAGGDFRLKFAAGKFFSHLSKPPTAVSRPLSTLSCRGAAAAGDHSFFKLFVFIEFR